MKFVSFAVLGGTIACDIAGQLCFKIGLDSSSDRGSAGPIWWRVGSSSLIWLGVAVYAVEIAAWLFVLSRLPLSLAFPLAALSYCGIAIAGRFVLHERVSGRRWVGTFLIALGAAIVGMSA